MELFAKTDFIFCPTNIYLLKVNSWNTRKSCEICPKLTVTPERRHCRNLFLMKLQAWRPRTLWKRDSNTDVVLVFLLLTLNTFHTLFQCFYCWLWSSVTWVTTFAKTFIKDVWYGPTYACGIPPKSSSIKVFAKKFNTPQSEYSQFGFRGRNMFLWLYSCSSTIYGMVNSP